MTTLIEVPDLPITGGYIPEWALNGGVINLPDRWVTVSENNQAHVPDMRVIAAGLKAIEGNPGIDAEVTPEYRASCIGAGPFDGQKAVNSCTIEELDALALHICDFRNGPGGRGCRVMTSQTDEANKTNETEPKSRRLNWKIGQIQDGRVVNGKQFYWTSGYSGFQRYVLLDSGNGLAISLSDLASKETILNYLRVKASPFGYPAFIPHEIITRDDGTQSLQLRGAAMYLTPLFQIYCTGIEPSGYIAAFCSMCVMLGRNGLEALATETNNGVLYHTTEQQALLRSRRICGFIANARTQGKQGGAVNELIKYPVEEGYLQSVTFALNFYNQLLGANVAMLCEEKGEFIVDFAPTQKEDHLPRYMPESRIESGYPVGYFGTHNYQVKTPVFQYVDDSIPVMFQSTSNGGNDVLFEAENKIQILREWVGNMNIMPYASVKSIGYSDGTSDQTQFCSTYTRQEYTFRRYKMDNDVWGYTCYNATTGNAGLVIMNYNLPSTKSHVVQAMIGDQVVETPRIFGGGCHVFIGKLTNNNN